jgi:hypothetical protein
MHGKITVLLNGQGEYCFDYKGQGVPPGCFTKNVSPELHKLLQNKAVRILADDRVERWRS